MRARLLRARLLRARLLRARLPAIAQSSRPVTVLLAAHLLVVRLMAAAHQPVTLLLDELPVLHRPVTVLLAARLLVTGLLAAARRAGGLPSGGQTGQVVPWMSESSGETSAMSGPVEWNAEPALARPSSARPRASRLPGAWWLGRRSHRQTRHRGHHETKRSA